MGIGVWVQCPHPPCPFLGVPFFSAAAETLVDRAIELDHVGGASGGNNKPTDFICLVLKMLQIQPDKDIVYEFIKNEDYKYVTARHGTARHGTALCPPPSHSPFLY